MNSFYDVQQLFKKHGTIIYTGDRQVDVELMEEELRELYSYQMIDSSVFQQALLLLRKEKHGQM